MSEKEVSSIKDISESKLERLSGKKIYFGHQSVGLNILDGVKDIIKENPKIKLNIVKTNEKADFSVPAVAHFFVGENTDPASKIRSFAENIEKGAGNNADIAFFKFCYVDFHAASDIEKVFLEYKNTMERLKKEYPSTEFIHVTAPLTTQTSAVKAIVKRLLGKPDNNINRNKFNELLHREYADKEPIFDLAKTESTYPNGSRASFTSGGANYYSLVPEYTDDGGHLNERGRKVVALELLNFLSNLK